MRLTLDYETRSPCDLKKCGEWVYAEHPFTEIMCCAVKVDGGTPRIWVPEWAERILRTDPPEGTDFADQILEDDDLFDLLRKADEIECHNAGFERAVWSWCATRKYGWPEPDPKKLRCSLAKCAYHALPRSLDQAAKALELPIQKDMAGNRLMMKMCKPRKPLKKERAELEAAGCLVKPDGMIEPPYGAPAYYLWHEKPEDIVRLCEYCLQDVETEHAVSQALPDLPASELKVWQLDQEINARGIQIDQASVNVFILEIGKYEEKLLAETKVLTSGAVDSPKKIDKSLKWLALMGVGLVDLTKNSVAEALMRGGLPEHARRFLEIRQQLGRASTAKYDALRRAASSDGRIRGTMRYHGAATGRFSGRIFQPQNLPRGLFSDIEHCVAAAHENGFDDWFTTLFEDTLGAASTCIRGMLIAKPGHDLISADFSSIEARVNAWIAGEESVLEAFWNKQDIYKIAAAQMFNKTAPEVTKAERQIGKTVELACIAEDEQVLTDAGLVPIQHVTINMKVWDGTAFVAHDGVISRGIRSVITYQGLTATEDHTVWASPGILGECQQVQLGFAASCGQHLLQSGAGGTPLRVGGDNIPGAQIPPRLGGSVCGCSLHRMWENGLDISRQFNSGDKQRLSSVLSTSEGSALAHKTDDLRKESMPEHQGPRLAELRRQGDSIQVPHSSASCTLDSGNLGAAQGDGTGSDRQQWPLRAGEPAVHYQKGESAQPTPIEDNYPRCRMGDDQQPLQSRENDQVSSGGVSEGGHHRFGVQSSSGQTEGLGEDTPPTRTARVYDILNAGQRNRFTVSDCLVHNCGYQGGVGAYAAMAKNYGIDLESLPEHIFPLTPYGVMEQATKTALNYVKKNPGVMSHDAATACDIIKQLWRQKRPYIVALWAGLEEACINAVREPGKVWGYRSIKYLSDGRFLRCKLPSGRCLHYYKPDVKEKETPWGQKKAVVTFWGLDSMTNKFMPHHLYGGLLCENCTQAASRDILTDALIRLEDHGYPPVIHVHDEAVSEVPIGFGSVEEYEAIMSEPPAWAVGCPIAAEGYRANRYKK